MDFSWGYDNNEMPSINCKNEAIKSALGWKPTFPSFRSGLTE